MARTDTLEIDGNSLGISDVHEIANSSRQISLAPSARKTIEDAHGWVEKIVEEERPVYGINTGFGIFSDQSIAPKDIDTLNRNLILSHAVATGPYLEAETVRAAMLIRANTLSKGFSGNRVDIIDSLIDMLNKGLSPLIPSQGSLGSSGDLAPLAHLALVLSTDAQDKEKESGMALFQGKAMSGKAAMQAAGIARLTLGPKEGLAISNGATFSAALAAQSVALAEKLLDAAEVALAMTLEALLGASAAFDARLHSARNHQGQILVAERIRQLTQGSTLLDAAGRIQDAYSLRCAPQVQGPVRETLSYVKKIVEREINASTDNPLIFGDGDSISGGNFHGQPIAMAMDYLKIALSELGAISERRTFRLTDEKMNAGMPAMLVASDEAAGLNSGMMMPQYTAASLVLENQALATPNSIHSLPTSGGKEDHNANSMTAARNAFQITKNTMHIIAIELYVASRALDFRKMEIGDAKFGAGVEKAHKKLRSKVPFQAGDALWSPEIEAVKDMLQNGEFDFKE